MLFLVRWIRLLVAREFSLEGVFYLWDRFFIRLEGGLSILNYCCASILLLKKESIMKCDNTAELLNEMQTGVKELNVCAVWRLSVLLWEVIVVEIVDV